MAGQQTLDLLIGVRLPAPQPVSPRPGGFCVCGHTSPVVLRAWGGETLRFRYRFLNSQKSCCVSCEPPGSEAITSKPSARVRLTYSSGWKAAQ